MAPDRRILLSSRFAEMEKRRLHHILHPNVCPKQTARARVHRKLKNTYGPAFARPSVQYLRDAEGHQHSDDLPHDCARPSASSSHRSWQGSSDCFPSDVSTLENNASPNRHTHDSLADSAFDRACSEGPGSVSHFVQSNHGIIQKCSDPPGANESEGLWDDESLQTSCGVSDSEERDRCGNGNDSSVSTPHWDEDIPPHDRSIRHKMYSMLMHCDKCEQPAELEIPGDSVFQGSVSGWPPYFEFSESGEGITEAPNVCTTSPPSISWCTVSQPSSQPVNGIAVGPSSAQSVLASGTDPVNGAPISLDAQTSDRSALDDDSVASVNDRPTSPSEKRLSNEASDATNHIDCLKGGLAGESFGDLKLENLSSHSVTSRLQLASQDVDLNTYEIGAYIDIFSRLQSGGMYSRPEVVTPKQERRKCKNGESQENMILDSQGNTNQQLLLGHLNENEIQSRHEEKRTVGHDGSSMLHCRRNQSDGCQGAVGAVTAEEDAVDDTSENLESLLFPDSNPEISMKIYETHHSVH